MTLRPPIPAALADDRPAGVAPVPSQAVGAVLVDLGVTRLAVCRRGMMLYPANDPNIGRMLELYGEFSEGECALFALFLRPGMTVVEVGANIGAHTVAIAQMLGSAGRVLAFEPQRVLFQMLCANLALNAIDWVEAHLAAAGQAEGRIRVPRLDLRVEQNFGGLALDNVTVGDPVALVTIDSLDLDACHLLKVDVEGMEAQVLLGAVATIRRHRPVIYAENDWRERSPELIALLLELDYRVFWHTPPLVRVPNFRGRDDNVFPGAGSTNLLCIPRGAALHVEGLSEVTTPSDWPFGFDRFGATAITPG